MKRLSSVSRSAPSISLPHVMRQHLGFFKLPENVPVENLLICPLTPPPRSLLHVWEQKKFPILVALEWLIRQSLVLLQHHLIR